MPVSKFKHSFATQRLKENGFKIFHKGNQILKYPFPMDAPPHWKLPKLETKLQLGVNLSPYIPTKRSYITYDDVLRIGFMISRRKPTVQLKFGQKVEYFLTKKSIRLKDVGEIPKFHKVERNPRTNEYRLIGANSLGKWVSLNIHKKGKFYPRISPFGNAGYDVRKEAKKYMPTGFFDEKPDYSKIIDEIVVLITEDGKLACIREERENPIIGIIGRRGEGKSIIRHRFMDNIHHKWNKKCIELNDSMLETDSYCQLWIPKPPTSIFHNLDLINEKTMPLPMVYLHPKTRSLTHILSKGETGFEIYLDWMDFILDFNNILKGKEDWQFKNSGVYFRNFLYDSKGNIAKDGLYYGKNYEQWERIINTKIKQQEESEGTKFPGLTKTRILNVLKDIDNAKILDVSNKTKAKWTVEFPNGEKKDYYPWTASIIADLVPSIVTHNISTSHPEFHPQYANFIMRDLFNNQNGDEYFLKNKLELFMFFDEILGLVDSPVAVKTFEDIIRMSRHSRIGFTYCSQYWDKIPEFITSQTDYVISFHQQKNQASKIVKSYDALKHKEKDLINLKKGECMIFSSNPIILIDEYGKKETVRDMVIKGTIFPSLSAHKSPKKM